jgi:dienelactone hydrolase
MSLFQRFLSARLALVIVFFGTPGTRAAVVEDVVTIPVTVTRPSGGTLTHDIVLTIVRDNSRAKAPFLVLNHGRSGDSQKRKDFGRAVFKKPTQYFVERGFVVVMPTRIGYGKTGGDDVENSGSCTNKNYSGAIVPAVEQIQAAVSYAKSMSYVDGSRGLIVGQSMGGLAAIAASAQNVANVRAVINFAGGNGGDPDRTPGHPCRPDLLESAYGQFGAKARVPTLWLYSENDQYWGTELPQRWFAAFKESGGKGRFVTLPPFEKDGHGIFGGNPEAWKAPVGEFLKSAGF